MPDATRRFPPPWSVEVISAAYLVQDNNGQKLAYVYYDEEPGAVAASLCEGLGALATTPEPSS